MIGKTISHYKILEELGRGGMGVVYKAEDVKLKRIVALKFLSSQAVGGAEEKTRFFHEAQAAAILDDSNICAVHEIEEWEGQLFIVMAYVEGQSLKEKIAAGPLKIEEAVDIAIQIAQGLQAAHEKGIVHRDVKPANILLTSKGQVRITDFGLAKISGRTKVTTTGTTLGTVAYMSPEQARGETVDHRSDIWSLGVVLYEMVTGQLPFKGEYEQAVFYSIMNEQPEPPTALRSGVPMELERIILKMLAKNPDERYQHMDELKTDLRIVQRQPHKLSPSKSTGEKPFRRKRKSILVTFVVLLFSLLLALFFLKGKFFPTENKISSQQNNWWQNSVAVLPFEDLSREKNQTYFCDGVTDDIISKLSKIKELKVINLLSVLRYRNSQKDLKTIGRELGVANILRGSLRKEGNLLHINVQLIKAENGFNLWGETYDFALSNLFQIQEQLATQIAEALQLHFSPQTLSDFVASRPKDLAIYEYSLKVKQLINTYLISNREEDFQRALKMIEKMIVIDSTDARPYVWYVWCYQNHFSMTGNAKDTSMVVKYIHKAFFLNPNQAETNACRAWEYFANGDYDNTFKSYQKALKINPNIPEINHVIGINYYELGLYRHALHFFQRAYALNPFYVRASERIAQTYLQLGDLQHAKTFFEKAVELAPENASILLDYVIYLLRTGQQKKAHKVLQKAEQIKPDYPWLRYYKSLYFAAVQNKQKALEILKYPGAQIYALLGMKEEALKKLEKEPYNNPYLSLLNNPFFDNLRNDSRFQRILAQRKKLYEEFCKKYGYLSP